LRRLQLTQNVINITVCKLNDVHGRWKLSQELIRTRDYNIKCRIDDEGHVKVTGSHLRYTNDISDTVRGSLVTLLLLQSASRK